MSLKQPTAESPGNRTSTGRRGQGAAAQSARYGYRRFRNFGPKRRPKLSEFGSTAASAAYGKNLGHDDVEGEPAVSICSVITSGWDANEDLFKKGNDPSGNSTFAVPEPQLASPATKPWKRRVCRYFATEKSCYFGEHCRFLHVRDESNIANTTGEMPSVASVHAETKRSVIHPAIATVSKDDIGKQLQLDVRNAELNYFGRRFRDAKYGYDGTSYIIEFEYKITDPEWVFGIKGIRLRFRIPEGYPCTRMNVTLSEPNLPTPLTTYFDRKVKEFFEEKFIEAEKSDSYVGLSKVFIRWLDHHIFELFVDGLRKTKMVVEAENEGISLHKGNFTMNFVSSKENNNFENYKGEVISEREIAIPSSDELKPGHSRDEETAEIIPEKEPVAQNELNSEQQLSSKADAIEARIQWNNLSGNIATLTVQTMALSIRCAKCSALSFMSCSSRVLSTSHCQKCSNGHSIRISPQLVHENSNVVAVLEPKGCIPVDCILLSSKFAYTCLQCNKEAAIENLIYGAANKTWCYGCHSKCEFDITAIRFVGNFRSIAREDDSLPKVKRKKKVEQQMMLIEGQPLPDNGTCKHYKKSYRWFRFPCCGKLYPCDTCHNEAEKEHEMKLANRMVCGFCSKEQPFQKAKQCVNCKENVTRVKSQFWEGGKGCRDQILMSRNDSRKHTNSMMKTVSKKHASQLAVKKSNASQEG